MSVVRRDVAIDRPSKVALGILAFALVSCSGDARDYGDAGGAPSMAGAPGTSGGLGSTPGGAGGSAPSGGGSSQPGGAPSAAGASNAGGSAPLAGSAGKASTVGGQAGSGGSATAGATSGGETGKAGGANAGAPNATAGNGGAGGAAPSGGAAGTSGGSGGGAPSADATIVPDPSWSCGMPDGIVSPTLGELAFRATLELGAIHEVGKTQYGERRQLDVNGGTLKGDRIDATFLKGGLEYELELSTGSVEIEQIDILRATDGTHVLMRSCGVGTAADSVTRIVPDFEAPNSSSLSWLNTGKFVGTRTVDTAGKKVELAIYDVSKVTAAEPRIKITDPAGTPNQPWECSTATGARGASVFTETVTLGSSVSIGASKRGSRNIIPITGGMTSGRVTGAVLPGGADYQLVSGSTKLDARYSLKASDGEVIIIRNCGAFGALVPLFEARADGPYAFLNENTYVSSDPGSAAGGVSITFYERN